MGQLKHTRADFDITADEVEQRFGYRFLTRRGERMGVYRVVGTQASRSLLTLRCDCGQERTKSLQYWKATDLRTCHCAEIVEAPARRLSASAFLGTTRSYLRSCIERRLKKLGLGGSAWDYTTPEKILEVAGPKPGATDLREPFLYIKDGEPPYAENFYWFWKMRPSVVSEILAKSTVKNRLWILQLLKCMTDDEIRDAMKHGIKRRKAAGHDYARHIGRRFGSLEVVTVSAKESGGTVYYVYTCKCHRCGRTCTKRAQAFISGRLHGCVHCGSQMSSARVKNSAVNYANKWRRKTWRSVESPGLPVRVAMWGYTGFFTLFFGSQEFIEASIDARWERA